jgi:hypothetical protein
LSAGALSAGGLGASITFGASDAFDVSDVVDATFSLTGSVTGAGADCAATGAVIATSSAFWRYVHASAAAAIPTSMPAIADAVHDTRRRRVIGVVAMTGRTLVCFRMSATTRTNVANSDFTDVIRAFDSSSARSRRSSLATSESIGTEGVEGRGGSIGAATG